MLRAFCFCEGDLMGPWQPILGLVPLAPSIKSWGGKTLVAVAPLALGGIAWD